MKKTKAIILGSGPAGLSAAIYLGRSLIDHIVIAGSQPGGQLTITTDVENYPGFKDPITGPALMAEMTAQAKRFGTDFVTDHIEKVDFSTPNKFKFKGYNGEYEAATVIIATGATAKWLGIESEKEFMGSGVSACATCDGFFFRGQDVIVIGGGNTAAEEALFLSKLCKEVTLVHRGPELRAEPILVKEINETKNIKILFNTELSGLSGEGTPKLLKSAQLIDNKTNRSFTLQCSGCFIAIGHKPNTAIFEGQIELDKDGYIVVEYPFCSKSSVKGVFVAGDVSDKIYRQAVTAAGSGCICALDLMQYLKTI